MNPADDRVSALDADYEPILPFTRWSDGLVERSDLLRELIDDFREVQAGLDESTVGGALADALNAAALETGAIEGLYRPTTGVTISVLEGVLSYANALTKIDSDASADLIAGQRDAFELALDVMTRTEPLSEAMIREIHRSTCAGQNFYRVLTDAGWQNHRLPKGEYKQNPNHVLQADGGTHSYAPVALVPDEMHRLVGQSQTDEFASSSAVVQSAYLHHALTHIHPFAAGNGRTARVLSSIPLLRATSVPLVVLVDRDSEYRAAQADADQGKTQRFVSFVENTLFDALGLLTERLRRASFGGDRDALAMALAERRTNQDNVESVLGRLYELVQAEMSSQVEQTLVPQGIEITSARSSTRKSEAGYVVYREMPLLRIHGQDSGLPDLRYGIELRHSLDTQADRPLELRPAVGGLRLPPLHVRLDELAPRPKNAFLARLEAWIGSLVSELIANFTTRLS